MVYVPKNYPDRIRQLRAKLGLSQAGLAKLLNVSFASVNRWGNAQSCPNRLAWGQILRVEREGREAFSRPLTPDSKSQTGKILAVLRSAQKRG